LVATGSHLPVEAGLSSRSCLDRCSGRHSVVGTAAPDNKLTNNLKRR